MIKVHIIGSGIAGLTCAYQLQQHGVDVHLTTANSGPDSASCSWWAGGMLAPYCEQETAEPLIEKLGLEGIRFWQQLATHTELDFKANGTLVVAQARDQSVMRHFERMTDHSQRVNSDQLKQLEPSLEHFSSGLFFADEAHLTPRVAIDILWKQLQLNGASIYTQQRLSEQQLSETARHYDWQIDCRGLGAKSALNDLRGVKGEMLHLYSPEVELNRPIRLLHPRHPLYVVPRADHLELLSAAYAIHPAFAEAEIIEIGVDARPAFDDNLPKIRRYGNVIYVNGLFRHGFLVGPTVARHITDLILNNSICDEVVDANYPEWSNHQHAANHT